MLSFPSSINRAGNNTQVVASSGNYPLTNAGDRLFDIGRIKAFNFNLNGDVAAEFNKPENMDISAFSEYTGFSQVQNPNTQIRFNATNAKEMQALAAWVQGSNNAKDYNEKAFDDSTVGTWENWSNTANTDGSGSDKNKKTTYEILGGVDAGNNTSRLSTAQSITHVFNDDVGRNAQDTIFFEDPFKLPAGLIDSMNRYTHVYKTPINSVVNMGSESINGGKYFQTEKEDYKFEETAQVTETTEKDENDSQNSDNGNNGGNGNNTPKPNQPNTHKRKTTKKGGGKTKRKEIPNKTGDQFKIKVAGNPNTENGNIYVNYSQTPVVSSIFNPIYMIQVMGMSENVPLLSNIYDVGTDIEIHYDKYKGANVNDNGAYTTDTGDVIDKDHYDKVDKAIKGGTKLKINPLNNIVDSNISNCTMRELVKKSHKNNSILGQARYRYADFMFCKDLGKVSNNHLITLRKFAHPVGDNIFRLTSPKFRTTRPGDAPDYDTEGDVGRLVTWFGTDDNKLEDLTKFSVGASWKELESSIQALGEHADSANKSVSQINTAAGGMGGLHTSNADVTSGIETVVPDVPKMTHFQQQLIYAPSGTRLMTQSTRNLKDIIASSKDTYGSFNYGSDKNKIYTPKNSIQATHVYEGKLTYEQEFTLNFCYKLRAYDNINPKSAFLDLLGNILEVTYRRGKFWGGARSATGPKEPAGGGNSPHGGGPKGGNGHRGGGSPHGGGAGPAKNENIADGNYDMLEGILRGLASGELDWQGIMAKVSDCVNWISDQAKELAQSIKDGWNANGFLGAAAAGLLTFRDMLSEWEDGLGGGGGDGRGGSSPGGHRGGPGGSPHGGPGRGAGSNMAKNAGKPALYAMDSLLKGDNVGLWHLTVGNPKNPIFVCGNLILTKATVNFSGPLGIDDFPTELKVSCSLKHGRARDIIEISKMYTKGANTLYYTVDRNKLADFFSVASNKVEDYKSKADALSAMIEEYELNQKTLEYADTPDAVQMRKKAEKEEWEKDQARLKEQAEAQGKEFEETQWKDDYERRTHTYAAYEENKRTMAKRNEELVGQIETLIGKNGGQFAVLKTTNNGKVHFQYTNSSSLYNGAMYDRSIYLDDEFTDEPNGEYINSAKALRYETLGQDRDYIGRMVIDEVS